VIEHGTQAPKFQKIAVRKRWHQHTYRYKVISAIFRKRRVISGRLTLDKVFVLRQNISFCEKHTLHKCQYKMPQSQSIFFPKHLYSFVIYLLSCSIPFAIWNLFSLFPQHFPKHLYSFVIYLLSCSIMNPATLLILYSSWKLADNVPCMLTS
jgi:hypothetical protein